MSVLVTMRVAGDTQQFREFFETNTEIPGVMRDAGAQGPPEITFLDAIETPDQF
jgi:hypothetical protein